jgi:esterase/lipase
MLATWQAWHQACELVLDDMANNCDRIVVAGIGVGGLRLAADNSSRVQGVIVISPTWFFKAPLIQRVSISLVNSCMTLASITANFGLNVPQRADCVFAGMDKAKPAVAIKRRLATELIKKLRYVRQPTLIVQPRTDIHTELRGAEHLQSHLPGPVYVTVLNQGAGNSVADTLLAFAARIGRTAATAQILRFPMKGTSVSYLHRRRQRQHHGDDIGPM